MVDWLDEAESLFAEPVATPSAMYTPVAPAPALTQLQSLVDQPTRPPTDIELGVAQLRAASPLEKTLAELEGRKLLFQEGLSFGVLPKVGAAATSLKEALYGKPLGSAFSEAVQQQDVLKEYVRQQELTNDNLILGISGPELAGSLLSPISSLYKPVEVAAKTPLATALAARGYNIGKATAVGAGTAGLQTFLSTPGTAEDRLAAAEQSTETGALFGGGFGTLGQLVSMAAPRLQSLSKSARRSALGATQADYNKTAGKRNFVFNSKSNEYTLTEQGVDNVLEKGYLGDSFDPRAQKLNLEQSYQQLNDELSSAVKTAGQAPQAIGLQAPKFSSLENDIKSGSFGSKSQQAKYMQDLQDIQTDINSRPNKLEYIQELKKYYGTLYDPKGSSADARFNRSIYHELQSMIETNVPEAKDLNSEIQSLILTRPIIDRRLASGSAAGNRLFNALGRMTYTTGGVFGSGLRLLGVDPLTSIASAVTSKAVSTPTGRNLIGKALNAADVGAGVTQLGLRAGQLASRPDIIPIVDLPIATTENADRPQYVNGQELADALKSQADKAPMLSEHSPSDVTDLKYDIIKLDNLYKQNNLGTLVINKTKGTQTFIPGYQPNIPNELASSEDEIEIRPRVKEILPTKTESQSRQDWLAEAESFLNSKQPEALSSTKKKGETAPIKEISAMLDEIPKQYGINPAWVKAIAEVESSFDPKAVGPSTRFGRAEGLLQLMPATAKALGVKNSFDPKQAIQGASKLLKQLGNTYGTYNDERLLFAAYNSRPALVNAAIRKAKAAGKDITWENIAKYMPKETQNYVKKVTNLIEA